MRKISLWKDAVIIIVLIVYSIIIFLTTFLLFKSDFFLSLIIGVFGSFLFGIVFVIYWNTRKEYINNHRDAEVEDEGTRCKESIPVNDKEKK